MNVWKKILIVIAIAGALFVGGYITGQFSVGNKPDLHTENEYRAVSNQLVSALLTLHSNQDSLRILSNEYRRAFNTASNLEADNRRLLEYARSNAEANNRAIEFASNIGARTDEAISNVDEGRRILEELTNLAGRF